MGVIYKLKDEVVQFIISQRQSNPLASCRQLAESASQKFELHLSKSSVHDVLKESGIITPRGRKPKNKFEIPQEKKKQIQSSLSQVKLLPPPAQGEQIKEIVRTMTSPVESELILMPDVEKPPVSQESIVLLPLKEGGEVSDEYKDAGRVFLKAIFWDLGISSEENIREADWDYYLTYSKGIEVVLENNAHFFIDLPVPIERCIRETVDGLVNNINPLTIHKVSDETLFKASMHAEAEFKMKNMSIVGQNDHVLFELKDIMEFKREFKADNRIFVDSNERIIKERVKKFFFSQSIDNDDVVDNVLNLKGFDTISKAENTISLLIESSYSNKIILQEAAEKLNGMYLRDEEGRVVKVKIQEIV